MPTAASAGWGLGTAPNDPTSMQARSNRFMSVLLSVPGTGEADQAGAKVGRRVAEAGTKTTPGRIKRTQDGPAAEAPRARPCVRRRAERMVWSMKERRLAGRLMTLDEYLEFEERSPIKHEYVAGEVYAMSGVTTRHNVITLNIVMHLRGAARSRGCKVYATDVKLRTATDRIYYPDVILACGRAAAVELIVEEPTLVVEVTSPSTRATDRREKLEAYRRIPSLQMYLIVEQRRRHLYAYTREQTGEWLREELVEGQIALPFLGAGIGMDQIYEDVELPPLAVGEDGEEWQDYGEEDGDDF